MDEQRRRRRNRRWVAWIFLPSLLVGLLTTYLAVLADSRAPSVVPLRVPPGFRAVSDGAFGYAIPSSWTSGSADNPGVGDAYYAGGSSWVAEHLDVIGSPPRPAARPPASLVSYGTGARGRYRLGTAVATSVRGAAVSYEYTMTGPGGFVAIALDAWRRDGARLWLVVHASPSTTHAVISSLRG